MKKIKCIFNIIIIFLLIISCSSSNKDNKEYKEVISTNSYKITNRIQIARVHFDFNKFNLTRDFIENAILLDLRTNTNILKLYIYGHTDNKGKDWWNYRLGLHRALTVSNIISTNYTSENIILKSFSYSNSIADNRTENGRYSNRRADIFIDLVEETFEIKTNLIKVDSKNEFNILSRFNIDLRILLIIVLVILFVLLIIIIIKPIIMITKVIIDIIKSILNIIFHTKFDTSIIKSLINISKLKYGKIILKIIYNLICKTFGLFVKILKNNINNHIKGFVGETLTKLKYIIEDYNIIGNGINDYKSGSQGLDLIAEKEGKLYPREIKFGTSQLGKTKDGKQGSYEYIEARKEDYFNSLNKKSKEYKRYRKLLKPNKYSSGLDRVDRYNPCKIKSKELF